jgi:hypothetical protein
MSSLKQIQTLPSRNPRISETQHKGPEPLRVRPFFANTDAVSEAKKLLMRLVVVLPSSHLG